MTAPTGSAPPRVIVLMGVCGVGKSTVGRRLAAELGGSYIVKCATGPTFAAQTGRYYSRGNEHAPSALALDDQLAAELWQRSAAWVGLPEQGVNAQGR